MIRRLYDIVDSVKKKIGGFESKTAVILGSGLGGYAGRMQIKYEISFSSLEGFPVSGVAGHSGKFLFGTVKGKNIIIMAGRVHYYEGYSMHDVVMPVRVLRLLGVENLIVTNAAGGVNPSYDKGDIMLITDHISLFCPNPLIGKNYEEFGTRFPDMSKPYSRELSEIALFAASKAGLPLEQGVYCFLTGPSYETAADVRALRLLGADSVGMSTVPEVTAANHAGMKVCGFSYIANKGVGLTEDILTHEDVMAAFKMSEKAFYDTLDGMVEII